MNSINTVPQKGLHLLNSACIAQQIRPDFVSENYGFVRTNQALTMLADHGWQPQQVQLQGVRNTNKQGYQKHKIVLTNAELLRQDSDSVPTITLINSHDRTSAFSFSVGFFRFICENGLLIGESLGAAFKVYHSGRELETNIYQQLVAALDNVPNALELREQLRSIQLDNWSQLQLAETLTRKAGEIRGIEIDRASVFQIRRSEDKSLDAWTQFNVLQENLTGALTGQVTTIDLNGEIRRKIKARSVKSIDSNTKLNKALFDEALKFFQLQKAG
jgi:hypothetical protein